MTKEEYVKSAREWREEYMPRLTGRALETELEQVAAGHKRIVQNAIGLGKPVPHEVLADYPHLAKSSPSRGNPMALTKEVLNLEMRIPLELLWRDEKDYLAELTQNIRESGITEPITIRVREDRSMVVWDGLHRLAVAEKLGIEQIPVIYIGG
ncbi:hypothetical protein ES703_99180 [subsurface metagenome]